MWSLPRLERVRSLPKDQRVWSLSRRERVRSEPRSQDDVTILRSVGEIPAKISEGAVTNQA